MPCVRVACPDPYHLQSKKTTHVYGPSAPGQPGMLTPSQAWVPAMEATETVPALVELGSPSHMCPMQPYPY